MLASLFPQAHARYTSLPVLGGSLEGLCVWLHARGYPRDAIRRRMGAAASLARALRRRRVRSLAELTASALSHARRPDVQRAPQGLLVRSLTQYLEEQARWRRRGRRPPSRVADYRRTRSCPRPLRRDDQDTPRRSPGSCASSTTTSARQLRELRAADVEAFVAHAGGRVGRRRMGQVTGTLRTFLRFLAAPARTCRALYAQVESPRIYRASGFLVHWRGRRSARSCARSTATTSKGRRDYAMFVLVATYGLRASESVRSSTTSPGGLDRSACHGPRWHAPAPAADRPRRGGASRLPAMGRPASSHRLFLRVGSLSVLSGWAPSGRVP